MIYPGDDPYHIRIDRNVNDFNNVVFHYNFEIMTTSEVREFIRMPDVIRKVGEYIELDFCKCENEEY